MTQPADRFPYAWTEEADVPAHLRVRAEGLPLREAIWSGLGYLRKYRRAKWTAPPEEVRYFAEQARLVRRLASAEADGPRLAMVGDLMWLRDSWGKFLSPEVLAYLNGHDAVLGNLETPVSTRTRVPWLLPDYFTFNSDPRLITSFRRPSGASTFSALATANNHCLDRGDAGLDDTLAFLDQQGIPHSGARRSAEERPWVAVDAGGVKVGFYAACWGLNDPGAVRRSAFRIEVLEGLVPRPVLPVDLTRIRSVLDEMDREGVEFKVVSLHWGHEFELYPCPLLMQVGREVIRAGADVIMGSHPHVVQPLEVCLVNGYEKRLGGDLPALHEGTGCLLDDGTGVPRKGLIAYSLGNFATAMYTIHCRLGLVLGLRLQRDASGRVDWHRPEFQLAINTRRAPATGGRRLMLLDRYLRECERRRDSARKARAMGRFLEIQLLGDGLET
jgi:poly-gamma-glutamate synthesis protein (capsule biosynthesis protein)